METLQTTKAAIFASGALPAYVWSSHERKDDQSLSSRVIRTAADQAGAGALLHVELVRFHAGRFRQDRFKQQKALNGGLVGAPAKRTEIHWHGGEPAARNDSCESGRTA